MPSELSELVVTRHRILVVRGIVEAVRRNRWVLAWTAECVAEVEPRDSASAFEKSEIANCRIFKRIAQVWRTSRRASRLLT
jgi:hypothetical protein